MMAPVEKGSYRFDPKGIVDIRNRLGMTQFQMALLLGVPPNTLSRWETGKATPDAHSLALIFSFAQERGLNPSFFRKFVEGDRTRLVVVLDFQDLGVSSLDIKGMDHFIMEELERIAPSTHHEVFKAFASPDQVVGISELKKLKWRVRIDESDQDEAIAQQVRSDCVPDPEDTVLVICSKGGDFSELVKEMQQSGVDVHMMAPAGASHAMLATVDDDHRTQWPARFPNVSQVPSVADLIARKNLMQTPYVTNFIARQTR